MDKQTAYLQAICSTYPDLPIESTHFNQGGQFNDVLIVNNAIIFRFPKAQREADKQNIETALLQELQERITLPVPNPTFHGESTAPIGQSFMGYHLLPGEPFWPSILSAVQDEALLQRLADQLATFLREMHAIHQGDLKVSLPKFQGIEEWRGLYQRFHEKLFPFMRSDARQWCTTHFETFFSDKRNSHYTPVLIHGDFGPSNILYDPAVQAISGIIDFASTGWGDPAQDFAAILCSVSYGEDFLARFAHIYPGIDAVLWRARFYAGTFALQEALYGIEDGDNESFERGIEEYR